MTGSVLTASHVALALVAAARLRGRDAAGIYESGGANRKARILAAASLAARLDAKKTALAKLFGVHPQELAPSMLAKADVTTDEMLEVSEALAASGLALASGASCPQPEAAPARPARKACAKGADRSSRKAPDVVRTLASPPRTLATTVEADAPAPARVPRPGTVSVDRAVVSRLKPVTASIARWGGYFLEAGWDPDEAAELFDVAPEALLDALDPPSAEARA
jgi:hypothetical protein